MAATIHKATNWKLPITPNCFQCGFFKDGECNLLEVKVKIIYRKYYEPDDDCPGWELHLWLPF